MFNSLKDESTNSCDSDSRENLCRDFLRNVCKRGQSCRYYHPESSNAKIKALEIKEFKFCHDFQKIGCKRQNCKFIHCSKTDEDVFHATGHLPNSVLDNLEACNILQVPICRDFLNGNCKRANRCKFRHLTQKDFYPEIADNSSETNNHIRRDRSDDDHFDEYNNYEPMQKRRAIENIYYVPFPISRDSKSTVPPHYRMLEEENAILLHKVVQLKKQVSDLTATNEFLLDQNAQLRVSKQTLVSPISQQLIPHTLTPTISSLSAPSLTQLSQIPLSTELGTTSLAPDLGLGQGIAPVSIAPSQVTLPTISAASLSQSLPQTIITSTALISYPIMTQSMRPVIQHSLG